MDFISNINGEFILKPHYEIFPYIELPKIETEIIVTVNAIDKKGVDFKFKKGTLDVYIDPIIDIMISELTHNVSETKRIVDKIVKAWDETPGNFKQKPMAWHQDEPVWENPGLLNSDEYHNYCGVVLFENLAIKHDISFPTGNGSDTYRPKKYYVEHIDGVDGFLEKSIKEIKSPLFRSKISKSIHKNKIRIDMCDVPGYISIVRDYRLSKLLDK